MNVTETFVGSMVGCVSEVNDGDSDTEPVAARMRPQLIEPNK
jgi:hypothetical protein